MDLSVLSRLPAVDVLLGNSAALLAVYGRTEVTQAIREQLENVRSSIKSGQLDQLPSDEQLLVNIDAALLKKHTNSLRPVLNLTGTVLHTNLGRARLPDAAIRAMVEIGEQYSNLEYDLESGQRGDRDSHIEALIQAITGAEAATVVNNNAAAVLLALSGLAAGQEVPVSRGELVEIGGSFRIPEIMSQSGCILKEIGATNRTHATDYEQAISSNTAMLMKVHTSNYEITGFTHSVSDEDVAEIAHRHGLPFMTDLGSGTLVDLRRWGLPYETTVQDSVKAGADVVTFSGDKLLGGPQCGIIVGRRELIDKIKKHPLKRALRVDKITLAALTEVLKLYLDPDQLETSIPAIRDLTRSRESLRQDAEILQQALSIPGYLVETCETESQIGSGALPTHTIPSYGIAIGPNNGQDSSLKILEGAFRRLPTPVLGRIHDGRLIFDLRTLNNTELLLRQVGELQL
ncbi:MAG: L-seryl-tRNA(Ser) seleniumtransferase [Candidatus Azotimanducaceae bacterium]|jgi:L-seryl-tRNA(Ser) seleniumtransferase